MCDYCNPNASFGNKSLIDNEYVDVFIIRNMLKTIGKITGNSDEVRITYCPMCKEKIDLKED